MPPMILENKREGLRLAESMKHVEHVIRLFHPTYNIRGNRSNRGRSVNSRDPKRKCIHN
jgi:hypothetical protein